MIICLQDCDDDDGKSMVGRDLPCSGCIDEFTAHDLGTGFSHV